MNCSRIPRTLLTSNAPLSRSRSRSEKQVVIHPQVEAGRRGGDRLTVGSLLAMNELQR